MNVSVARMFEARDAPLCTTNFVTAERANAILNENVRGSRKRSLAAYCNWSKAFGHVPFPCHRNRLTGADQDVCVGRERKVQKE